MKENLISREQPLKVKIWVVDDEFRNFSTLETFVSTFGNLELFHFSNGEEALKKFLNEETKEQPTAIFIDGNLGAGFKTGDEIIEEIRKIGFSGKIIAMSGTKSSNKKMKEKGADEAILKGGKGYINNLEDLLEKLNKLVINT